MPRHCTVCSHPSTTAIDQSLKDGHAGTTVALRWGLSIQSVQRHDRNHRRAGQLALVGATALATSEEAPEGSQHGRGGTLASLLAIRDTVAAVQAAAAQRSDPRLVLDATRVQLLLTREIAAYEDDSPEQLLIDAQLALPLVGVLGMVVREIPTAGPVIAAGVRALTNRIKDPLPAATRQQLEEISEWLTSNTDQKENQS